MSEKYTTSRNRAVGFQLLCDTLMRESKKNNIKALLTSDKRQRLIYEIKSLGAVLHLQKIVNHESDAGEKGALKKTLRELSQKYEILSICTNDPEKRAEYRRKSEQYKKDGEEI